MACWPALAVGVHFASEQQPLSRTLGDHQPRRHLTGWRCGSWGAFAFTARSAVRRKSPCRPLAGPLQWRSAQPTLLGTCSAASTSLRAGRKRAFGALMFPLQGGEDRQAQRAVSLTKVNVGTTTRLRRILKGLHPMANAHVTAPWPIAQVPTATTPEGGAREAFSWVTRPASGRMDG